MRIAFVGASRLAVATAQLCLPRGIEVVIIERNKERIDTLAAALDCGYLHADGTRPDVLRELGADTTDALFCLTGNDQANIIASLVGRALGFKRVITKIDDAEFEHVGIELGLEEIIVPARATGRYLVDMLEGREPLELSAMIKGEARMLSFVAHEDDVGPLGELDIPKHAHPVCLYRKGELMLPDSGTRLRRDDEVVLITQRRYLQDVTDWLAARKGIEKT